MRRTILALLLAATACTPDNNVVVLKPDIVVSPQNLDFGDVIVDYSSTLPISIQNTGRAPLTISDISFDGARSGAFSIEDGGELEIEADDVATVNLTFTPPTYLPYTDEVVVHSDAPDEEAVVVRLFGEGVDGPKPDIQVNGHSFEFDASIVGTKSYQVFEVSNDGEGDLVIDSAEIDGSDTFSLLDSLDGQTITGGGTFSTAIQYVPDDEEGDNATLTVNSNDPDEPALSVILLGNGGGDFAYPIADFDCPSDVAPLETLSFDGSASYDPNGLEPLDYYWTLSSQPSGSGAELSSDGDSASMLVDLAGDYMVSLLVQNSVGIYSETATCSFTAIPSDAIHVELTWNTDETDLDLHMLDGDAELFSKPGDVCYCNPNPSWGSAGSDDDPTLDLDEMYGYGPENTNIEIPADGEYPVLVHYFLDHGGGATTATVRVYLNGDLTWEGYELLENKDLWSVGTISWPDATFTPSSDIDPYVISERTCTD